MDTSARQLLTAVAFLHRPIDGVEHVFLAKRAETKAFLPGVWELPGGHVEYGESMEEGLRREIREEHGMDIRVGDPFCVFTYENAVKRSHSAEVLYFATFLGDIGTIRLNPEDHSECGWFSEAGMDEIIASKGEDDPEMAGILRGFALLRGEPVEVG